MARASFGERVKLSAESSSTLVPFAPAAEKSAKKRPEPPPLLG
jgi:hypothetical protein